MTSDAELDLKKTEALWFSPDVVVLRAQTRIFRVFVAILKEKSSVFADMFTFPQPASLDMETIEGSPVVDLTDDPAEVEVFLKAIFDSEFFLPPPASATFGNAVGILRLSHKYNVSFLRRRSLEHLGRLYHTSLLERDSEPDLSNTGLMNPGLRAPDHLVAIKVVTDVDALWLLPAAYYELCRQDVRTIMISGAPWIAMSKRQMMATIVGHSAQIQHFPKIIAFHSDIISKGQGDAACPDSARCNRVIRLASAKCISWELKDPIARHEDYWEKMEVEGLCRACLGEMRTLHQSARQKFWDQLPQMFGQPGWAELKETRRAQLALPGIQPTLS
ncbi:hypothetical protein B0H11DRAFT_2216515 [Mycena galericulata]|nr:hypothetical protein B0H11DRAFT_2216515 [Mycena galericulata]